MNWTPFVPPLIGLWMLLSGLRGFVAEGGRAHPPESAKPPEADAEIAPAPPAPLPPPGRTARLKSLAKMALGAALIWWSGLSVGLRPTATASWSGDESLPEALRAEIQTASQEFLRSTRAPGMVVVVAAGRDSAVLSLGRRGLLGAPVDSDTIFEIGSVTKVFTGILLARAVERDQARLEQPVAGLLNEIPDLDPRVTLRGLATHTAGMPRLPSNVGSLAGALRALTGGDPYRGYGEPQFHDALRSLKLAAAPGVSSEYSNYGVALLGHALAKARGLSYAELLRADLLDPVGLADTAIRLNPSQLARFTPGHTTAAGLGPLAFAMRSAPWDLSDCLAPAGGIRSTGADMRRFLRTCMELESSPLSNAVKTSTLELHRADERRGVGMAWQRNLDKELGQVILWHNGGTGGFRSHLGFTEDRAAGVVVLCNASVNVDPLAFRLLRLARRAAD